MSTVEVVGRKRVASVRSRIVCIRGDWFGHWFDGHYGTGHHTIGPCPSREKAAARTAGSITRSMRADVTVIFEGSD